MEQEKRRNPPVLQPNEADRHLHGEIKKASIPATRSEDLVEQSAETIDIAHQHAQIDLDSHREKARRRKLWDRCLLLLVILGFFFSYLAIILIGLDVLHFADSTFAVPAVVGAGIIQTYGLAKIAAEYFFSEGKNEKE